MKSVRLHVKAVIMGFQRAQRRQYPNQSILRLEGVNTAKDALFYMGKRVAYVYQGKKKNPKTGSRTRVIWGRIARTHGNNGSVRAKFAHNLPPVAISRIARVMLYPSHI
eukprot:m51a1_g7060 putative 60S ribosomal protein L33e (109) ;mRNA; f:170979-171435